MYKLRHILSFAASVSASTVSICQDILPTIDLYLLGVRLCRRFSEVEVAHHLPQWSCSQHSRPCWLPFSDSFPTPRYPSCSLIFYFETANFIQSGNGSWRKLRRHSPAEEALVWTRWSILSSFLIGQAFDLVRALFAALPLQGRLCTVIYIFYADPRIWPKINKWTTNIDSIWIQYRKVIRCTWGN